jgi:hypothetical protein
MRWSPPPPPKPLTHRFYFINDREVKDALVQIEGGALKDSTRKATYTDSLGGSVAGISANRAAGTEHGGNYERTRESAFRDLHDHVVAHGKLKIVNLNDEPLQAKDFDPDYYFEMQLKRAQLLQDDGQLIQGQKEIDSRWAKLTIDLDGGSVTDREPGDVPTFTVVGKVVDTPRIVSGGRVDLTLVVFAIYA